METICIPNTDTNVINVNSLVTKFTNTMQELSMKAGFRHVRQPSNDSKNENCWFDDQCKKEKKSLLKLGKSISNDPNNPITKRHLLIKKRSFKKLCNRKKLSYYENKLSKLDFKDPKKLGNNSKQHSI